MRLARRLVHVLLIVMTLVVGATAAAIIVAQTGWFKNWLRVYIVREVNQYLNGQVTIERLGGNLFFGVELQDIAVSMDGHQVVAVKDIGLDYDVFELISRGMSVDEIRLNQPVLYLRREGDAWSISRLIKKQAQEADRQGPAYPIAIDGIGISDALVVIDGPVGTSGVVDVPRRFEHIDARLAFKYEPVRYSIDITHVSFRGFEPAIGLNAMSGGVSVRNDTLYIEKLALRTEETSLLVDGALQDYLSKPVLKLQASSDKASLSELGRVFPALAGIALQPAFELTLNGPLDQVSVDLNLRSSAGQLTGRVTADVMTPGQSVVGDVSVRHLDLAPILKDPTQKSDVTADAKIDVKAAVLSNLDTLEGSASVYAPRIAVAGYVAERVIAHARFAGRHVAIDGRASAYGADTTVNGRVTLSEHSEPLAYDLRGTARHLDLRRLPASLHVQPVDTNVNADYRVRGSVSWAEKQPGGPINSRSSRTNLDADLRFAESIAAGARVAPGSTAHLSLHGGNVGYQADATLERLDPERIGQAFNVPALADDRYKSLLNGHVTASGDRTTLEEVNLTAQGSLFDSSILGGHVPQLSFDVSVADDTAHVRANGSFADFDPAVVSGKPAMKGTAAGTFNVDATVAGMSQGVTIENLEATVVATLQASTIGGLAIDRATVDGGYDDRVVNIRQFEIVGRDLNAQASGTLALNESGRSNLTFHADTPSLQEIGKLVETPLTGIAKIDGTITGNRSELQAVGTLIGDGVTYQKYGALTVSTTYSAHIPDLTVERARVSAETTGTFVTLAGQNINELVAKTTYADKEIAFEATARQPERSLTAAGSVALHPDHQEAHLEQLTLNTLGVQWQLAPDSQPAMQYGDDAIGVDNLKLVNGDQQMAVDGTFGRKNEALKVTLTNVDVASVDALMLGSPRLSGRLNGAATVSGSKDAPSVKADFQINQGGFRQFRYDTFGGTVAYAGTGITLDTKLQQNASQWITAKGSLPAALFSAGKGTDEPMDLTVDSSPIDLGLIQGFTTKITNVTGTLEAHVHVTGSVADPRPSGMITVQNGTATVEPTGVPYSHIAGRIDLQPDRIHIDQITILDNHDDALSVTGDLAIHERQLGGVQIYVNADDFKAIDNAIGNVRIQSSLEISGDLKSPRVEGYFGITTGLVNLDEIIALTGDSAYATEQTAYAASADEAGHAKETSLFDALTVNVGLTVPDDLIVRASSLQTPGSPIGLGALNVTLGGDLQAIKDPGDIFRLRGIVKTIRGTYDFQGRRFEILRDGTVRFERARSARSQPQHPDASSDSRGRSAREPPRHAQSAGNRVEQHAAARGGRHPLADRVQPADQSARRGPAGFTRRARAGARRWRRRRSAPAINRPRAQSRDLRDRPGAGERRRASIDHRPAVRTEPVRQGVDLGVGVRLHQLCARIRAGEVAASCKPTLLQGASTRQNPALAAADRSFFSD